MCYINTIVIYTVCFKLYLKFSQAASLQAEYFLGFNQKLR